MSSPIAERFTGVLLRVAFFFEPLAPSAISYYLRRRLNEWKREGLISEYKTRTRRLGKFHYKIEVDLDLNSRQAIHVLNDLLPNQMKGLRRWFDV